MDTSSISVNIRVRPFTVKESSQMQPELQEKQFFSDGALASNMNSTPTGKGLRKIIQVLDERVLVFDPADTNPMARFQKSLLPGKKMKDVRYAFDHIFDENASQKEVYEHTSRPLLDGIFDGFNATVFAYGATGCGKTHTISGTMEDPGLIFLTFEELFQRIRNLEDEKIVEVSITYLEIYNETIRDLLIPGGSTKVLNLREDANKQISVAGLSSHVPQSVQHVMEMILMGNGNRTISPTEANAVSSRSHAVLQVNVTQKARTANISEDHTMATLSIIDLAGSERASVTKNRGERLLEGANINRSLLALGNCINALCDPHRKCHIPYRDSKLTRLLKFSLGGNCRTVMVVCVSPSSAHYDETHNTLKYGNRAKNIKTKVSRNIVSVDRHVGQYVKIIYSLRQEVEELKKKLGTQSNDDSGRVEKEQKLQSLKYDEAVQQLRSAFEQNSTVRLQRPQDVLALRATEQQINILTAWLAAFNIAFDNPDYQDGLEEMRPARDKISHSLRELEHQRSGLEHKLRSCHTLAAIDTVLSTLLRNHKSDGNRVLCKAIEAEANLLKDKVARETFEAEVDAARYSTEATKHLLQNVLLSAFSSTACLNTDGGQTEEETERFDQIYSTTYQKGLSLLNSLVSKDLAVSGAPTVPLGQRALMQRHASPRRPMSPLRLQAARLSSSSSPRPSPRSVRIKAYKPHTVFAKKKPSKKSVQWADADVESVPTTNHTASPLRRQYPDHLNKRRSLVPIASPPGPKRKRVDEPRERSVLGQTDANADTSANLSHSEIESSMLDHCIPVTLGESQAEDKVRPIRDFKRPSSAGSNYALEKPFRTTLSGLAMANLSVDMEGSRRVSKDKENDRPTSSGARISSLSNPLRQSLAGRVSKSGTWR
ncbi:Kinesin family protein [Taphrina deformans PYCC 5710]|uniref:Kinesin-like protein n=1 Tax=Taphrina deformans (strain PYCC 5710 / ATCC 11124 / CBS 356.35 / IMI 108563 / JCM 9778 / NBRC 8474) TaxID=1097556 RepID=R4XHL4_TAPDE|nr:Kinesin family protein [Taphrina deformans PYCC 5710]|eukprot:CCG82907.1 Kinesin family protein [Taphrina deformans PYCC 5710]